MERPARNRLLLQHETGGSLSEPPRICGAPSRLATAALVCCAASLIAVAAPSFGVTPVHEAAVQPKGGKYSGKTTQASVQGSYRRIRFTVKGKRIRLTTEPVIRHGFCLSPPVFIEEGGPAVTKKISANGTFSFERTFEGSRINRIRGTFVDENTIEGTIRYFFYDSASGQCTAGKETPRFTAER
jgi:hypothetical protein